MCLNTALGMRARYVMIPLVTETVTGTWIVIVPSEIVIVVFPLKFTPMPIDVTTKTPVDAGVARAETPTDDGPTVTIVVSLLVAVNVPVKPGSLTVICWLPFTPPNERLAGFATSGTGVGVGEGVGVGDAVGVAVGFGDAGRFTPEPPQPASTAKTAIP